MVGSALGPMDAGCCMVGNGKDGPLLRLGKSDGALVGPLAGWFTGFGEILAGEQEPIAEADVPACGVAGLVLSSVASRASAQLGCNSWSLWSFPFKHDMYRSQNSVHNAFTFSSSIK